MSANFKPGKHDINVVNLLVLAEIVLSREEV